MTGAGPGLAGMTEFMRQILTQLMHIRKYVDVKETNGFLNYR